MFSPISSFSTFLSLYLSFLLNFQSWVFLLFEEVCGFGIRGSIILRSLSFCLCDIFFTFTPWQLLLILFFVNNSLISSRQHWWLYISLCPCSVRLLSVVDMLWHYETCCCGSTCLFLCWLGWWTFVSALRLISSGCIPLPTFCQIFKRELPVVVWVETEIRW